MEAVEVQELGEAAPARRLITDIQQRADGSYVVTCDGLPFHATESDTPEVYQQVLEAIAAGAEVEPLQEAPVSLAELEAREREWRDAAVTAVLWLRERHRDEQDLQRSTTLTQDQFTELLTYLQQLRDWPQSEAFPAIEHRPVAPPWIAEQTQ